MSKQQPFRWISAAATHVGNVRQVNEDALLERSDIGLWAVADGMGGHHAGDVASSSIVNILDDMHPSNRLSAYVDEVEDRILAINDRLRRMAAEHEDNRTIGSTIVAMIALASHCAFLWAGDSRVYRSRNNECVQITRDHSQVEEMVQQGLILREDAEQHPAANIITRAVGASDNLYIDVDIEELQKHDTFLLCSDGLYKHISDEEIAELLKINNINDIPHQLINTTLERGAIDNVTVIAIRALPSQITRSENNN
ncbi:MAG: serine/threonine-protein phosphatase [Gammaproteobacteria bacterium]|nr:serine/threonine-protein phosphatase [Gammaproteobacteria bacterium]